MKLIHLPGAVCRRCGHTNGEHCGLDGAGACDVAVRPGELCECDEFKGIGDVAPENRKSGGSISAECPCGEGKNPLHALLKSHQPPPLNKSGGSDVEGVMRHADGSECRDYSIRDGQAVCRHRGERL